MDLKMQCLQKIIGAHSITNTVLNHFYEGFSSETTEDEMLIYFQQLCNHFELPDEGYNLLSSIFEFLKQLRNGRFNEITLIEYNFISEPCKDYINWVFNNFKCFKQSENGKFIYNPTENY